MICLASALNSGPSRPGWSRAARSRHSVRRWPVAGCGCGRGRRRGVADRRGCRCCRAPAAGCAPGMVPPFDGDPGGELAPAARPRPRSAYSRGGRRTARCTGRNRRPARSTLTQVSLRRPGLASILVQKAGTAKAWMTSVEVTMNFTTLPTGMTMRSSTASSGGPSASVRKRSPGLHVGLFLEHVRDDLEPAIVGILVGPIPLVADHLDGQVGRRRRILVAQQADRGDRDRHQDQHRDQGPDDLDQRCCGWSATASGWRRGDSGPWCSRAAPARTG